ncbi:MAG: complex I subunit 1 family protein [bacterium]|nr:complex I subunit 1 family protein [bacterium]
MTGNWILDLVIIVLKAAFLLTILLTMAPVLIVLERKISAFIQDRPGPNRADIFGFRLAGFVYVLADAIKLFTKENFTPSAANRFYYYLAPAISVMVALSTGAVVPFADSLTFGEHVVPMQVLPINAGLLWFFAIASLGVYGIVFAGWASNSKYSLLGSIRSSAQLISYEIPMGLSVVGLLMAFQTLELNKIVQAQGGLLNVLNLFHAGVQIPLANGAHLALGIPNWGIFIQPVAFVIFLVASYAETNRTPFDLAESESELVAGFHTEYSAMKFGMFFFAEYMAMVVASSIMATLFFGGWQVPFLDTAALQALSLPLVRLGLGAGAGVVALAAFGLYRFYLANRGRFGDRRDLEGLVLAVVAGGLAGLLALACLGSLLLTEMPVWGAVAFAAFAQFNAFFIKMFLLATTFVWVRWTVPRFRYDQLMDLGWKSLLPLALANIFVTGLAILLGNHFGG